MRITLLVCVIVGMLTGCRGEVPNNSERTVRKIGDLYCKKHGGLRHVSYGKYSISFTCRNRKVFKVGF